MPKNKQKSPGQIGSGAFPFSIHDLNACTAPALQSGCDWRAFFIIHNKLCANRIRDNINKFA